MVWTAMDKNYELPGPAPPFDLDRLTQLSHDRLRRLHVELFGCPGRVSNPDHFLRKIAWELQASVEGRLSDDARELALTIARHSVLRSRPVRPLSQVDRTQSATSPPALSDPRLPRPGSCLVRTYGQRKIVVKVLASGFEFDGRHFSSLSSIAREVTGTRWNGFVFFALIKRHARKIR